MRCWLPFKLTSFIVTKSAQVICEVESSLIIFRPSADVHCWLSFESSLFIVMKSAQVIYNAESSLIIIRTSADVRCWQIACNLCFVHFGKFFDGYIRSDLECVT